VLTLSENRYFAGGVKGHTSARWKEARAGSHLEQRRRAERGALSASCKLADHPAPRAQAFFYDAPD
jgi:hypothetical protein